MIKVVGSSVIYTLNVDVNTNAYANRNKRSRNINSAPII